MKIRRFSLSILLIFAVLLLAVVPVIPARAAAVSATGGTITYSGGYTIHTFTSNGTFTVSVGGNIDVLIVGGGGGGGNGLSGGGGGGGAGGVIHLENQSIGTGGFSIVVGAAVNKQTSGNNSSFNGSTAHGGGKGADAGGVGTSGGSGGGGGRGTHAGGSGTGGEGYAGGTSGETHAGGGGGASEAGHSAADGRGGGDGYLSSISGTAHYYGGGGSGGWAGGGGDGGGGQGATSSVNATAGTNGDGGGGGGGYDSKTGAGGGSGVVIIRYLTEEVTSTPSNTPTETFTPTETSTPTETYTPTETSTATSTATETPTATITETPTATTSPTITETPTITMTPTTVPPIIWADGPVTLSDALLEAMADVLEGTPPEDAETNVYAVTNISGIDTAWNISIVNLVDVVEPYTEWTQEDNAAWAWFFQCTGTEPTWSCDYYELPPGGGDGTLRFPWKTGFSASYGIMGVHAGAQMVSGSSAVDFLGGDSMGSSIMPPQVVAVSDGTITSVCSDGVSMAIRVDGGPVPVAYFHFNTGQSFSEGQTISQGQVLGQLKYGTFSGANCGYAVQSSDQYHVHFVFVPTSPGYLEIGGCVLDMDTEQFVCNGKTYGILQRIPNGGSTSDPGTPSPPGDGTINVNGGGAHIWDGIVDAIVSLNTDTLSQYLPNQNPLIAYVIQKVSLVIQAMMAVFMAIYSYGMTGTVLTLMISAVIAMEVAMKVVELAIYVWKEAGWLIKFFV